MRIPNKLGLPSFQTAATFMTLTAMWMCCGCSDDFETPSQESGARLQFEANVAKGWNNGMSRASAPREFRDTVYVLDSESGCNPLYLHTRTEQNTANPFKKDENPGSRGTMTTEVGDSFRLFAGFITDSSDESEISADYIYNEECKRNDDGKYSPNTEYRWVGNRKLKIFAYTPYNPNAEISSTGTPELTYTVAEKVEDQEDLLVASCIASPDADGVQELNFSHALTAVQFVATEDVKEGSIKSISINGVYSTATTSIGSNDWHGQTNPRNYTLDLGSGISTDGSSDLELAVGDNTFLMIPQTLPEDAKIVVEFIDITNTTRTLCASIADKEWQAGTIITYRISTQSILYTPVIELSEDEYTFPFHASLQTKEFAITSYTEVSKKGELTTYREEPFSYELLDENGNPLIFSEDFPPYITAAPLMAIDNSTSETSTIKPSTSGSISVAALTKYGECIKLDNPQDNYLKSLNSTGGVTNLAGNEGHETTANCYIIDNPGKYNFPIVYGNGLVGGIENTKSFTNQKTKLNTFINYPNYRGNPIKHASILEDEDVKNVGIWNASLLWQDYNGLITNVTYKDGYIYFEVPKESIREGNALIALIDNSKNIIWSWHIWIAVKDADVSVTDGSFMGSYIGYCHPHKQYYPERNVKLRITQEKTKHYNDILINLSEGIIPDVGNSVLYQWGRKDPMPGLILDMIDVNDETKIINLNKPVYSIDGSILNLPTTTGRRISIDESILYPTAQATTATGNQTIWHNPIDGIDNLWYLNLWDANSTTRRSTKTEKTIYDPSPVGYSIPTPELCLSLDENNYKCTINENLKYSYNLLLNGSFAMGLPNTLRRDYTGLCEEGINMDQFYIWGANLENCAIIFPRDLGKSNGIQDRLLGNVALPVLPMLQN